MYDGHSCPSRSQHLLLMARSRLIVKSCISHALWRGLGHECPSYVQLAAGAMYRKPKVRKTSEKPLLRIVTPFPLVSSPLKIFLPPCHATVVSADAHCLHPGRDACVSRTVRMEPTTAVSHRESCHASSYLHVVQVSNPVFANVRGSTAITSQAGRGKK